MNVSSLSFPFSQYMRLIFVGDLDPLQLRGTGEDPNSICRRVRVDKYSITIKSD
jgi:hypothetical protein